VTPQDRPLSAGQEAFWFMHRLHPDSAADNVATAVRIHSPLDVPRLAAAVTVVARRHAMLRSTFAETEGMVGRRVLDPGALTLEVCDAAAGERAFDRATAAARTPFRLVSGQPAARFVLFRTAPDDAVLLLLAHHIVTDGVAQWLVLSEVFQAYADPDVELPAAGDYDTFVDAERRLLRSPSAGAFWRARFADSIPAELPTDHARPPRRRRAGSTYRLAFPDGTAAGVRRAAAETGVTPFGFLLGVFAATLHRHSGQRDLTLGCAGTARRGPRDWRTAGYLVSPFPVRARFGPGITFAEAARAADTGVADGLRHGRYPLPLLIGDLDLPHRLDRTPLFQITVTMLEANRALPLSMLLPGAEDEGPEREYAGLRLSVLDIPQMEGGFDLSVELRSRDGTLAAVLRYDSDLYEPATIERLARHYARLVDVAVANPGARPATADLLDDEERRRLLALSTGRA
jgi:hypothetical protein